MGWVFGWLIFAVLAFFAFMYYQKRFETNADGVHFKSLFESKSIAFSEIAETSLNETEDVDYDGDVSHSSSFEIIGTNGVSMVATDWLQDFSAFRHLVGSFAQ